MVLVPVTPELLDPFEKDPSAPASRLALLAALGQVCPTADLIGKLLDLGHQITVVSTPLEGLTTAKFLLVEHLEKETKLSFWQTQTVSRRDQLGIFLVQRWAEMVAAQPRTMIRSWRHSLENGLLNQLALQTQMPSNVSDLWQGVTLQELRADLKAVAETLVWDVKVSNQNHPAVLKGGEAMAEKQVMAVMTYRLESLNPSLWERPTATKASTPESAPSSSPSSPSAETEANKPS